ncbi:MAG: hypothetical protein K7J46_13890 [Bryobacter sp.]|jgi:hypothetical protein|nr:hypothetical protein [Bryobacter sp. CoA8 C33]
MPWQMLLLVLVQDAVVSSPDLDLHYPSAQLSTPVAREMRDALDEEYGRIRHDLGCVIGSKVTAIVVSLETWQATGHSPWAGAYFDGRIVVPLVYERSRVGPQMRRVFAHEMVHACISRYGSFPTWLHEGLAQYLSGERISEDQRRALRQALSAGRLPPLERLSGSWTGLRAEQAAVAYAYALWAAETWIEAESLESVRQILRQPSTVAAMAVRANELLRR